VAVDPVRGPERRQEDGGQNLAVIGEELAAALA